ncbi:hypothetical protein FMM05_11450 [Flavobacterium zepuense]|uniref:Cyclophilin-like domain-containing protein n=1 Tax=Flavobacterium zepuense TaxID=2593302 RepID=A0A552V1W4_9FLAO|nr:cyclophilin-like fold protein [Flavobacterium zepuense]TRW24438.1 hypothetical protein FMM05_11450 [Flavobacterium zepuense]
MNAVKHLYIIIACIVCLVSCGADQHPQEANDLADNNIANPKGNTMKITVSTTIFTATLLENATVNDFKRLLPLTVSMSELNGNEKYADLPVKLSTNAVNPGTIETGDLMLFGPNALVVFYKTFPASYTYTKLGKINNTEGLAAALGTGNVSVTFELQ